MPCPYGFGEDGYRISPLDCGGTPLGFFVSAYSKGLKVLCFDTVLQVFILLGLALKFNV